MELVKVQFVTRVFPIENSTGGRTYVLDVLKYFKRQGFEIELVMVDSRPGGRSPIFIVPAALLNLFRISFRDNFKVGRALIRLRSVKDLLGVLAGIFFYLIPETKRGRFVDLCSAALRVLQPITGRSLGGANSTAAIKDQLATPGEKELFEKRFKEFKPDIIMVYHAWLAGVLDSIPRGDPLLKIIIAHDVIHQRVASAERLGIAWNYSPWNRSKEAELLQKADVVLAIQNEDAETFRAMAPNSEVICAPMSAVPRDSRISQIPGRCLFVGSNGYNNVQGLRWLLENVWPTIIAALPHCKLHVCGTVCNELKGEFAHVELLGRIDNLEQEYSLAELCLIPLQFGSGLKIKLVEALSYGRACVTTSIGLQGLSDLRDKAVVVADSATEFSKAVKMILTDEVRRRTMEFEARRYVGRYLSPDAVYQPLLNRIHKHMHLRSARNGNEIVL
ncbi:MAG: glycosyltransferase family 4 protein [Desulfobacterales bacterium]|nr:MAG: glycosyltransferase family 4 protein [Desulfobacterales bacterium]